MRRLAVIAVLAAGCYRSDAKPATKPPPAGQPIEQVRHARTAVDPLGFLPVDAELVAQLDARQVRRSALWARFEPRLMSKAAPTLDQFRAMCGFDPLAMIERIAFGLRGLDTPELGGVLVVRGIARTQLMPCVDRALAREPAAGRIEGDGIVTVHGDPGEPPVVFAFADARTLVLVAGHGASVPALRDTLEAGVPLRSSPAFSEMFARIDASRAAWFFLNGNSKVVAQAAALGFRPKAVYGAADVASGFAAKLYVRMPSPAEAQRLATLVQSQLGPAKPMVERIEVGAEDADVVFDFALTDDQVAMIVGLVGGP